MSIDIKPSTVSLDAINAISSANDAVLKYNNDIDIGEEALNNIFVSLGDNTQKALDLIKADFNYCLRKKDTKQLQRTVTKFLDMSTAYTNLSFLIPAMRLVARLIEDVKMSRLPKDEINVIVSQLTAIQSNLIDQKNLRLNEENNAEDSLPDADLRLSALLSSMLEIVTEFNEDCIQLESVKLAARKVGDKVKTTISKAYLTNKSLSDRLNEKFNRFLGNYKADRKTESYETVVNNSLNLSRMIKNLLGSSIVALLVPGGFQIKLIAGAITLLLEFAMNKRTEYKHKNMILNDLKLELKIVQEKIKDAEGKGDNQAKYKLMRIENDLNRAIDRIHYGLAAEGKK